MLYFAYGSNMFTYRLEKRIGSVAVVGLARLSGHQFTVDKPSKDGSLKANVSLTDNSVDNIYGVLFEINPTSLRKLDAAEGYGKGYDRKEVKVELLDTGDSKVAFTYYATDTDQSGENLPYSWYMELINAGAEQHKLPGDYQEFLKSIPGKEDPNPNRRDVELFVLQEYKLPRKFLDLSFNLISSLKGPIDYRIDLPGHVLHGQSITVNYQDHSFQFSTESPIPTGLQTHKELDIRGIQISLKGLDQELGVDGESFLINQVSYDTDKHRKLLAGELNTFRTAGFGPDNLSHFRLMLPRKDLIGSPIQRDYGCGGFTVNYLLSPGLIQIKIGTTPYHFYNYKSGAVNYYIIDCLEVIALPDFQHGAHSILMSFAFLSGLDLEGEGWFLSFDDKNLDTPVGALFHKMGTAASDNYKVFTSNRFFGIDAETVDRNPDGSIMEEKLYPDLKLFPIKVFEKFCQAAYSKEKILRSLVLLANNQTATLEMKLPVQYVVLEAISAELVSGGNAELKLLPDHQGKELVQRLNLTVEQFASEFNVGKDSLTPITKKIAYLNSPTNRDKLGKVFGLFGYNPNDEEGKIIKDRDTFLHGSLPKLAPSTENFRELFHRSLRLHFLISVLLLKNAGYSGRIINYAQLYRVITGKFINEPVLVMI